MQRRLIVYGLTIIMVLCLFPTAALAADNNSDGYDDNDFDKLQAFLDQPSAVSGKTNGQAINDAYDRNDPTTWTGVAWSSGKVFSINWWTKSIAGTLDISGLTSMWKLTVNNNGLTSIDVSGCTSLEELYCNENALTAINLNGCTALKIISCYDNELSVLDVSQCPALEDINCSRNQLASLDFTACTALNFVGCRGNQLTSLNVSKSTVLGELYCYENQLTSLDVSANTALTKLHCRNNKLTELDVSANAALTSLECNNNELTSLDVSKNIVLQSFNFNDNQITEIDLSANTALTELGCSNNQLTSLDISANTAIYLLECAGNNIENFDISTNTGLLFIDCSNIGLTELDLTANTRLFMIICKNNPLKSLKVILNGKMHQLTAVGGGYVELVNESLYNNEYYANAVASAPSTFVEWTQGESQFATEAKIDLVSGEEYNLTANFTCGVTFNSNGGDTEANPQTMTVTAGQKISEQPTAPTRTGFISKGWYKEPSCTNAWDFDNDVVMDNVTLYAKWEAEQSPTPTPTLSQEVQKGNITGTIEDADGKPLANYPVTLHSDPVTVITDSKGKFTFENVPLTSHTLVIKKSDGTQIGSYDLTFTKEDTASYENTANKIDIKFTAGTVNVNIDIDVNADQTGTAIDNVSFSENPATGDKSMHILWLIAPIFAALLSLCYIAIRKRSVTE